MVHYKLNDEDEEFLQIPPGALVLAVVKAGERLAFKAYPKAINAHLMRTVVYTAELKPERT